MKRIRIVNKTYQLRSTKDKDGNFPSFGSRTKEVEVPLIPLSGSWLHDLGFSIGSAIEVQIIDGKIVISKFNQNL